MPIREPRIELDRQEINDLLGWSGVSVPSIARFVSSIIIGSSIKINELYVFNRGMVEVEDTERRSKNCWMISIWNKKIGEEGAFCVFQQPVPIKVRYQ